MPTREVAPEALTAMGNCCLAISSTVAELIKAGFKDETTELVQQLMLNSRSLRISIRDCGPEEHPDPSIDHIAWIKAFLGTSEKAAGEVISEATKAGLTKSQIFQAREELALVVNKNKHGFQLWRMP